MHKQSVTIYDREFVPYISAEEIAKAVQLIAQQINTDYKGKMPLCIPILNGTFMFTADLFKQLDIEIKMCFVKLASYQGTKSTGNVITAIGMEENITDKDVIIIDDILDTGKTLYSFISGISGQKPRSIRSAVLLHKSEATIYPVEPDYVGLRIPPKFVLGYGLDYDGLGRNLPELYCLKEDNDESV